MREDKTIFWNVGKSSLPFASCCWSWMIANPWTQSDVAVLAADDLVEPGEGLRRDWSASSCRLLFLT